MLKNHHKNPRLHYLFLSVFFLIAALSHADEPGLDRITYRQASYHLYPATIDVHPDIPSPFTTENGVEIITGFRKADSTYTIIPVTVENGGPRDYKKNQWGKGNQLDVDSDDFPVLAETGLHSDIELDRTVTITGRPIAEITEDGRPKRSSYAGFLAEDEDIIGVLRGDNRLVKKLGLTHPELAKPLFHVWNILRIHDVRMRLLKRPLQGIDWFDYDGRRIFILDAGSGHGWQESIFNDGNLGMWQIELARDMSPDEKFFLETRYPGLDKKQMDEMIGKLTYIHTGEMVPYYIMRYGFYEGHTSYRADPIAIAYIFGLRSIEEIENAFSGRLYEILTTPFVEKKHLR